MNITMKIVRARRSGVLAAALLGVLALAASLLPAQNAAPNWTSVSTLISPSARYAAAMAYDPVSQKVVLFGGYGNSYLGDTWTFNGIVWTKLSTKTAPGARYAAALAYDQASAKLVLFGGFNGTRYLSDTWEFDGASLTWAKATPSFSPPATFQASGFTDPANGHADIFGGYTGQFYSAATYQWSGSTWTQIKTQTSPSARSWAFVALDEATNSVVLFGGLGDLFTNNTWTFDGSNWHQEFPVVHPAGRYGAGGAYSSSLHAAVMFGGNEGSTSVNETWSWDGTNWQNLDTAPSPSPRVLPGMVYDPAAREIVLFGGINNVTPYKDTWVMQ